jgi:hypothetical protein
MAVPFLSDVLGGTPETYQSAGHRRGTATSNSTTTGTTSEDLARAVSVVARELTTLTAMSERDLEAQLRLGLAELESMLILRDADDALWIIEG